ncbi:hypothetical protein AB0C11_03705 [Streptomyces sp. NPDC039016]|uniref:hypothetical protein n=1 Tax=Streptomyces sp. NPDC039016 TaxID=3154330 RepID=UPI0033E21F2A
MARSSKQRPYPPPCPFSATGSTTRERRDPLSPDDDRQLRDLAEQFPPDAAPCPPVRIPAAPAAPFRRWAVWLILATAIAVLVTGVALAHGLLLAGGLVLAGLAGQRFTPPRSTAPGRRR